MWTLDTLHQTVSMLSQMKEEMLELKAFCGPLTFGIKLLDKKSVILSQLLRSCVGGD